VLRASARRPRRRDGGGIRDRETAVTAAEAALTGHLILTTLHSLDAIRAIGRLLAMGVQSYIWRTP
jgi:general secretion pathway protein E